MTALAAATAQAFPKELDHVVEKARNNQPLVKNQFPNLAEAVAQASDLKALAAQLRLPVDVVTGLRDSHALLTEYKNREEGKGLLSLKALMSLEEKVLGNSELMALSGPIRLDRATTAFDSIVKATTDAIYGPTAPPPAVGGPPRIRGALTQKGGSAPQRESKSQISERVLQDPRIESLLSSKNPLEPTVPASGKISLQEVAEIAKVIKKPWPPSEVTRFERDVPEISSTLRTIATSPDTAKVKAANELLNAINRIALLTQDAEKIDTIKQLFDIARWEHGQRFVTTCGEICLGVKSGTFPQQPQLPDGFGDFIRTTWGKFFENEARRNVGYFIHPKLLEDQRIGNTPGATEKYLDGVAKGAANEALLQLKLLQDNHHILDVGFRTNTNGGMGSERSQREADIVARNAAGELKMFETKSSGYGILKSALDRAQIESHTPLVIGDRSQLNGLVGIADQVRARYGRGDEPITIVHAACTHEKIVRLEPWQLDALKKLPAVFEARYGKRPGGRIDYDIVLLTIDKLSSLK